MNDLLITDVLALSQFYENSIGGFNHALDKLLLNYPEIAHTFLKDAIILLHSNKKLCSFSLTLLLKQVFHFADCAHAILNLKNKGLFMEPYLTYISEPCHFSIFSSMINELHSLQRLDLYPYLARTKNALPNTKALKYLKKHDLLIEPYISDIISIDYGYDFAKALVILNQNAMLNEENILSLKGAKAAYLQYAKYLVARPHIGGAILDKLENRINTSANTKALRLLQEYGLDTEYNCHSVLNSQTLDPINRARIITYFSTLGSRIPPQSLLKNYPYFLLEYYASLLPAEPNILFKLLVGYNQPRKNNPLRTMALTLPEINIEDLAILINLIRSICALYEKEYDLLASALAVIFKNKQYIKQIITLAKNDLVTDLSVELILKTIPSKVIAPALVILNKAHLFNEANIELVKQHAKPKLLAESLVILDENHFYADEIERELLLYINNQLKHSEQPRILAIALSLLKFNDLLAYTKQVCQHKTPLVLAESIVYLKNNQIVSRNLVYFLTSYKKKNLKLFVQSLVVCVQGQFPTSFIESLLFNHNPLDAAQARLILKDNNADTVKNINTILSLQTVDPISAALILSICHRQGYEFSNFEQFRKSADYLSFLILQELELLGVLTRDLVLDIMAYDINYSLRPYIVRIIKANIFNINELKNFLTKVKKIPDNFSIVFDFLVNHNLLNASNLQLALKETCPLNVLICLFNSEQYHTAVYHDKFIQILNYKGPFRILVTALAILGRNNLLNPARIDALLSPKYSWLVSLESLPIWILIENHQLSEFDFNQLLQINGDNPLVLMQRYVERNIVNDRRAQSTHIASVHESASKSIRRLDAKYGVLMRENKPAQIKELADKLRSVCSDIKQAFDFFVNKLSENELPIQDVNFNLFQFLILMYCEFNAKNKLDSFFDVVRNTLVVIKEDPNLSYLHFVATFKNLIMPDVPLSYFYQWIDALKNKYESSNVEEERNKIILKLRGDYFKTTTAFHTYNRLIVGGDGAYQDPASAIALNELILLVFWAIKAEFEAKPHLIHGYFIRLIETFYEIEREYNFSAEGIDRGGPDSPMCLNGSFNKLIEKFQAILPECEIITITPEQATHKLMASFILQLKIYLFKKLKNNEQALGLIKSIEEQGIDEECFYALKPLLETAMLDEFARLFRKDDGTILQQKLDAHIDTINYSAPERPNKDFLFEIKKYIVGRLIEEELIYHFNFYKAKAFAIFTANFELFSQSLKEKVQASLVDDYISLFANLDELMQFLNDHYKLSLDMVSDRAREHYLKSSLKKALTNYLVQIVNINDINVTMIWFAINQLIITKLRNEYTDLYENFSPKELDDFVEARKDLLTQSLVDEIYRVINKKRNSGKLAIGFFDADSSVASNSEMDEEQREHKKAKLV